VSLLLVLMIAAIAEQAGARKRAAAALAAGSAPSQEVPATLTPESAGAVLGALQQAWVNVTGQASDHEGLLILAAQGAMETANFAKLYDFNLGNIMHTAGDGYDYNHRPEVPQASMIYRVYSSLLEGAEDLVRWAIHHGAGDALQNGDLSGYMNALRAGCYLGCIGNEVPGGSVVSQSDYDTYEGGIQSYVNRFASVKPIAPPSPFALPPIGWGGAIAAVAVLGGVAYVATHIKDGKLQLPRIPFLSGARKAHGVAVPTPAVAAAPGLAVQPQPQPQPQPSATALASAVFVSPEGARQVSAAPATQAPAQAPFTHLPEDFGDDDDAAAA